jgi:DUF4097 and DUF4098 domain-containing protein YvlB
MIRTMMLLSLVFTGMALAQPEDKKELTRLQFSDPKTQGHVDIHLLEGSIEIVGHDSEDIVVYANRPMRDQFKSQKAERNGLRAVRARSSGIEIKEVKNHLRISSEHWANRVHLYLMVPRKTSLNLHLVNGGYVMAKGVSGEHNIEVVNGALTMTEIRGTVLANVLNEDIKIELLEVTPNKPMSFSTLNGTIDVTLPANTKATLFCDTKNGEIYTGFDSEFRTRTSRKEHDHGHGSHISIKEEVTTDFNGGSEYPYVFKTMNGDILIRKGD